MSPELHLSVVEHTPVAGPGAESFAGPLVHGQEAAERDVGSVDSSLVHLHLGDSFEGMHCVSHVVKLENASSYEKERTEFYMFARAVDIKRECSEQVEV